MCTHVGPIWDPYRPYVKLIWAAHMGPIWANHMGPIWAVHMEPIWVSHWRPLRFAGLKLPDPSSDNEIRLERMLKYS